MPNLIGQSLGRYHILEQLGEGGMATVYKAYDTHLERDVAIKFIRRDVFSPVLLDRVLQRFEREAKALAKLSHPNIVHIHDYGEYQGAPYLVMEYLPGGTLKDQMGKPLYWTDAVRLLLPVGRALQFAHEQGIIHRDIKPSNILITQSGEPMLSDFGIAKILDTADAATLTATGVGVGTPEYMAPEQGMGRDIDARADLYSLGIVLYELITGRKPFTADTPMAVVFMHLNDPLPRPQLYVRNLPEAVEKLLIKALAKRPDDRYASMSEFIKASESLLTVSEKLRAEKTTRPAVVSPSDTQVTIDQALEPATARLHTSATNPPPSNLNRYLLIGGALVACAILVGVFIILLGRRTASPTPPQSTTGPAIIVVTSTPEPVTPTSVPVLVSLPTELPPPPPTSAPAYDAGATIQSSTDGMTLAYIPAGDFAMGSNDGYPDESPAHRVELSAYWMDTTEVTNDMYRSCVSSGGCNRPGDSTYYANPDFSDHPVAYVNWQDARSYCQWAGRRLPTEAEWEKGARGTDARIYPWGDSFNCAFGNFDDETQYDKAVVSGGPNCDGFISSAPVGSFRDGASPYGLLDMAGNVWEWVNDWYSSSYYDHASAQNPTGPNSGSARVVRGGSWNFTEVVMRTSNRLKFSPSTSNYYIGFRCAQDAP